MVKKIIQKVQWLELSIEYLFESYHHIMKKWRENFKLPQPNSTSNFNLAPQLTYNIIPLKLAIQQGSTMTNHDSDFTIGHIM